MVPLGRAAGSLRTGLRYYDVDPGKLMNPPHSHSAEEEVFDKAGHKVGEVDGVELDPATGRIVRIIVRRGTLFRGETAIPASLIAKAGGHITLSASADEVKKLERA